MKQKINDSYTKEKPRGNCPNGQKPYLKYHLQLKIKEDAGGSGLGLQK